MSIKKFAVGFVGVALALTLVVGVGVQTANAAALTPAQVSAIISLLQSFGADQGTINNVNASLTGGTPTGGTTTTGGYVFTTNLTVGSKGADVMNLQKVLNSDPDTRVAVTGAGSPGNETSTFGPATKAAVIKFQIKKGITPAAGYVGAITRAALNALGGGTTPTTPTTPTTTTGTGLTITAGTQPAATLAPEGATRVPFTTFTLTAGNDGDVTVNSVTVQRMGLAHDAVFTGVELVDNATGQQIGVSKTFNSNHQAIVGEAFVIPRGTTKSFTIAGDMATTLDSYAGEVPMLSIIAVNTSAAVSGSLPINGTGQTTNATLSLGSVTVAVSSFDPNSAQSVSIGTTGFRFAGLRITAGSAEDVRLNSIRWNQSGSAAAGDLANVVTIIDGVTYPTTISADGKYYSANFGAGVVIAKGFAKDIYLQGDLVGSGSSSRTVQFDIYKKTDIYMTGETYHYGVTAPDGSGSSSTATTITAVNPWFDASKITVSAGTVTTITKANSVPAQNIAVNVPNQVLGGYSTDIKGEPISVQQTIFTISTTTATPTTADSSTLVLTNVSIVDENGAVVAGPVDAATAGTLTFTDTITYPLGQHTYTLKGKVNSSVANGQIYILSTKPSTQWSTIKGVTTGNTVDLSALSTAVPFNQMTVRTASLAISASTNPASQAVIAGTVGQLFTNFQFDATQSGEDVRLSSIALALTIGTGAYTDVSGCQLFDGSTALNTGSNVVNPTTANAGAETFTFDSSLTIPKGTVKTVGLKCNISSSASNTYSWGASITASNPAATGVTSSNDVNATTATVTGPTMTVGSASLAVSTDSSSPSYTVAAAGSSGVTAGVYKFRATNDSVTLQRIGFTLTNTASSSASDITQVTIWDGATQVGSAVFTGSNTKATSTLNIPVTLPKDADKTLTIKADLAGIGVSLPVSKNGHLVAVDVDVNTNTQGVGVGSGGTVNATGSTSVAGIRVFKTYPTLALDTLSSSGVTDGRLMRFKVTADSHGPVGIAKFTVGLSTSSATVNTVNIFGFTDSAYSQPISGVNTGGQFLATAVDTGKYVSAPTNIAIYPQTTAGATTTINIPLGTTWYFEVRGTVTPASGATNYSVVTTLKGDTAYPKVNNTNFMTVLSTTTTSALGGASAADADGNSALNNFIWSPNATTTATINDPDWTNGYGLQGLPSNGLIQSRTN